MFSKRYFLICLIEKILIDIFSVFDIFLLVPGIKEIIPHGYLDCILAQNSNVKIKQRRYRVIVKQ